MRTRNSTIGRLGVRSAAVILAALSAAVAVQTPAQGVPPGCAQSRYYEVDSSQNIHAHNYLACEDGTVQNLAVSISRYVSPDVWTTVASGYGYIVYYCNGHAYNVYTAAGYAPFANTCG